MGGCTVSVDLGALNGRIDTIAGVQRTIVGRRQLQAVGVDDHAIARRLSSGELRLVHRAVFQAGPKVEIELVAETAALLAAGADLHDDVGLGDHSAATLWGLRRGVARPIHLVMGAARRGPSLTGVVGHRSRLLAPEDLTTEQGLPVTTPARTVLDNAKRLGDRGTELLIAEGFVRHILTEQDLRAQTDRAGRHPGRWTLDRILSRGIDLDRTDSDDEEALYQLIVDAGLPRPRTQSWIGSHAKLDFHWPTLRLAVEVDAFGTHGSRQKFHSDRARDATLLTEHGITTVRVTRDQIRNEPLKALATVAQSIAGARHRPG